METRSNDDPTSLEKLERRVRVSLVGGSVRERLEIMAAQRGEGPEPLAEGIRTVGSATASGYRISVAIGRS